MFERITRRLRRSCFFVSRHIFSSINQVLAKFGVRSYSPKSLRTPPRILFALPESDPYIFNLFWGRLFTSLSETASVDILHLPHISSGQNISDSQCELLASDCDAIVAFIKKEFETIVVSSRPGITLYSVYCLLDHHLLASLHRDIFSMSGPQLLAYQWRDLRLGEYLPTDLSLCRKSDSISTPQDLNFARLTLFFAITACIAFLRLYGTNSYARLAFNNSYTFNLALKALADSLNVKVVNFWSRSSDPGFIAIYSNLKTDIFLRRALSASPASFASTTVAIDFCTRYLRQKLVKRSSSQMYSPRGDKSLRLKILPPHTRYITYFTSSPDELRSSTSIFALEPLYLKNSVTLFESECDVIRHLAGFCATEGLVLVVRLHPRLGREQRSGFLHQSSALQVFTSLQQELSHLSHVVFIQPETPVCSYSLGLDSLVNVFWWSTIGIELAMLGATCMPAIADQAPGLGIRYHCFASRLPKSISAWDSCLADLLAKPRFDYSFVLQACCDFYFSIGFGFVNIKTIESDQLLAMIMLGTSIQEPEPAAWDPPSSAAIQHSMNELLAGLEA